MTFRLLLPEEWQLLEKIFLEEWGYKPPTPSESCFAVCEAEGEIVACVRLQVLESFWLHKDLRKTFGGAGALRGMLSCLADTFPYLATVFIKSTTTPKVKRLAQYFGFFQECELLKG